MNASVLSLMVPFHFAKSKYVKNTPLNEEGDKHIVFSTLKTKKKIH
jgi:hypothetical protein